MADDAFDLDLAMAALRANQSDVRMMLDLLVDQLGAALGGRLTVERGGLRKRSGPVRAVEVTLGGDTLRAEVEGAGLRTTVARTSGGIRIRTETVDTDTWLRRLLSGLQAEAAHSDTARQALERMVLGGEGIP